MKNLLLIIISLFIACGPAQAENPPLPKSKQESLSAYDRKLEAEKSRQQSIEREMQSLSKDLEATKEKLLGIAQSVSENEASLQTIETRMAEMESEETTLKAKLEKDQLAISRLVLALERISRVPPQALIMRPGAPLQTAQSAMLLGDIIPMINKKSQALKADLHRLDTVSRQLAADRVETLKRKAMLETEQKDLSVLIKKRESIFIKTQKDYEKHSQQIRKISAQAENLKDLVKKLEENNRRMAQESRNKGKPLAQKDDDEDIAALGSGDARLPVSGIIRVDFNQTDKFGAPSKGLKIEGRTRGLVVAPLPGKVRFTGDFKNYGNMIIIEHASGYHSLIAGLEKIDTLVGQTVQIGEPIGLLKRSSGGQNPVLYYELRHNGQPVNPATKLAGLG